MPGSYFVLHAAHGQIGNVDVCGPEIIGYDPTSETYRSVLFDSHGNINEDRLAAEGDTWTGSGAQLTGNCSAFPLTGMAELTHEP